MCARVQCFDGIILTKSIRTTNLCMSKDYRYISIACINLYEIPIIDKNSTSQNEVLGHFRVCNNMKYDWFRGYT